MLNNYDVIVIGAGHAGCEASVVAAKLKAQTLLITLDFEKFGQMSCNPAVGGIAKGQIVREVDALGGQMGIITDLSTIQFRMLNRSKGPAMWSPRAQCDRQLFSTQWRYLIENTSNLDIWQDKVESLIIRGYKVSGVITRSGMRFNAKKTIIASGTFFNGVVHIGNNQSFGGRIGEPNVVNLSSQLTSIGFETGRMKTGTPPRLDGKSIDFSKMKRQNGDDNYCKFSFSDDHIKNKLQQFPCYITYTNKLSHKELRKGFDKSPMHNGNIKGTGPRYCPSIEAKLTIFPDKSKHLLFLEPEGINTHEYYLNGFSTALPPGNQLKAIQQIEGLENAKLFRPGYAIEYDYFIPTQLYHTMETKLIGNLYFAGQINGTTGYEEAAAQGIIAGINAVLSLKHKKEFILRRDEAYIGVLIDDLVTKGVDEPYRMFTSRAEHRILLRQDNADTRLTPKGFKLGLATKKRMNLLEEKTALCDKLINFCETYSVKPPEINNLLLSKQTTKLSQSVKLKTLILRPQIGLNDLTESIESLDNFINKNMPNNRKEEILGTAEIIMKYSGYIDREKQMADKLTKLEHIRIKGRFNYNELRSISTEGRQKLTKINPQTIGQASRIPGVSPTDINVLLVLLKR